jgi:hypothetical protein
MDELDRIDALARSRRKNLFENLFERHLGPTHVAIMS